MRRRYGDVFFLETILVFREQTSYGLGRTLGYVAQLFMR